MDASDELYSTLCITQFRPDDQRDNSVLEHLCTVISQLYLYLTSRLRYVERQPVFGCEIIRGEIKSQVWTRILTS